MTKLSMYCMALNNDNLKTTSTGIAHNDPAVLIRVESVHAISSSSAILYAQLSRKK